MDAAHELGHLVLHRNRESVGGRQDEAEAHEFASALLMPATAVRASAPRAITLESIFQAKHEWGVSALAYVRRLHVLGVVSKEVVHRT
jgi:Zn-dependent peptidase ImmA (M78 family)